MELGGQHCGALPRAPEAVPHPAIRQEQDNSWTPGFQPQFLEGCGSCGVRAWGELGAWMPGSSFLAPGGVWGLAGEGVRAAGSWESRCLGCLLNSAK